MSFAYMGPDFTPHVYGEDFTPSIVDIAYNLSHLNRYTGSAGQYSVAQHSVLVARNVREGLRLDALLHDAPEAYLGDVAAPLKAIIGREYRILETKYHNIIDRHYHVQTRHADIKVADMRMLATELFNFAPHRDNPVDYEPFDMLIEDWTPERAQEEFLQMFYSLGGRV